jgi:HK97 family phage prohead protease
MPHKKGARASVKREVRVIASPQKFTIRRNADGSRSVSGYFATFNTLSHDMGFREKLLPGAFSQSLLENPVQCLFNHDNSKLLGRTESKTLKVQESSIGLRFDVTLPDTTYANDLVVLMERGDAFECSFGFSVPDGGDSWSVMPDGATLLRQINTAILFEGSILVSPAAYPNTSANLRSLPSALRSKLTKRDDIEDGDSDFDDPTNDLDCEGEDEDDPACTDENRAACECTCKACAENRCERCSDIRCADLRCMRNGCFIQSDEDRRKHNHDVSVLQLRLKLQQHRRPPIGN